MFDKIKTSHYFVLVLIILAAIVGGGAPVFGKIGLTEIPVFSFVFLRFLVASIFLIPFSLKCLPKFRKKDYKIILLSLSASANVVLFSFGIKHTTANINQMIYTAVPIVMAVLSFYLLKERFSKHKIWGIIIGFLGTLFIILLPLFSGVYSKSSSIFGNLIIVVAMLSISLYWVLSKKFQNEYSSLTINNYFIFTTTFLLFFLSIIDFVKNPGWYNSVSTHSYLSLLFVAIFSTAIYYLLSQMIIKRASPVMAGMVLYIQPATTFIWAYYFLNETLSALFIFGAVLTLIGVGIYNFSGKNKKIDL
jgi:drug/metabolite transporter (DMT)-like permease